MDRVWTLKNPLRLSKGAIEKAHVIIIFLAGKFCVGQILPFCPCSDFAKATPNNRIVLRIPWRKKSIPLNIYLKLLFS